ncbi:SurA N-terminal domain-containing protein [Actinophytocola sp.]|uniref:SurA N-terminal domain-containing protein n=1 Tax=Actinophytocola sp. TaxID=1872138 RepID=UPI002EDA1AAB
MTTAKLRPRATKTVLIAVLTALVAALTACGSGPSQINSAVLIDGRSISVDEVQAILDKVVKEQPAARPLAQQHKLDLVAREALSQLIVHDLVTKAAREQHITANRDDVAKAMNQDPFGQKVPTDGSVPAEALAAQLVYRARDLHDTVTDQILLAQLADKNFSGLKVTMDYTTVASDSTGAAAASMRKKAEAKAHEFADNPNGVADLIAKDRAAGLDANEAAEFAAAQLQDPALVSSVMFGAEEGSVVAFQPSAGQAFWVVGLIRKRETNASGQAAQPPQLSAEQIVAIGKRMLQPLADKIEIKVSPRYGTWDAASMGVVASAAESTGIVLAPSGTRAQ